MEHLGWLSVGLCCGGLAVWALASIRVGAARHDTAAAAARYQSILRILRMSATDQRSVGLSLLGLADVEHAPDSALAGLARRLLDMSDTLTQQTDEPAAPRYVADEDMLVMPVVQFAVEQVVAQLGPSRRAWRLDPEFSRIRLRADRRAVNQVLVNVLAGAASSTRDGDWIEISAEQAASFTIVVQDEGLGLPVPQKDARPEEGRGIGLRLTLARSLMKAHGGRLLVESVERIGTRVRLELPIDRLVEWGK